MRSNSINEYLSYTGPDVSLEISLYEYGLIWKEIKEDYKFIYGVHKDRKGNHDQFDHAFIPIGLDVNKEFDWAEFDQVASFVGKTIDEWFALPLPQKIQDLLSYYGYENIFGESILSFRIK